MRSSVLSILFALVSVCGCQSQPSSSCVDASSGGEQPAGAGGAATTTVEQDIRELLVLTKATAMAQQVVLPMVTALANAYPMVPRELWGELLGAMATEDFTQLLVDVYERNYTREEVSGMLRFYRSPLGRGIVDKMPVVVAEAQQAGQVWGQRLTEKLIDGARKRGYEL